MNKDLERKILQIHTADSPGILSTEDELKRYQELLQQTYDELHTEIEQFKNNIKYEYEDVLIKLETLVALGRLKFGILKDSTLAEGIPAARLIPVGPIWSDIVDKAREEVKQKALFKRLKKKGKYRPLLGERPTIPVLEYGKKSKKRRAKK